LPSPRTPIACFISVSFAKTAAAISLPLFEIYRKLFEMGATVEELFEVEYNEMHCLGAREALTASSVRMRRRAEMLLYDYKPRMPVQERREWRGVKNNVYFKER
jgi:hypothetical protein